MQGVLDFFTYTKVGLLLNIVGTVMVAVSFGENPGGAHQDGVPLASFLRPWWFKLGLGLIFVGFVL